jgi:glycosyltransferase involved in cell wall biosynthesis
MNQRALLESPAVRRRPLTCGSAVADPPAIPAPGQMAFLRANSDAYEWLVRKLSRINPRTDPDAALSLVAAAAQFAAAFHPGRFADGAIENVAVEIGRTLSEGVADRSYASPPSDGHARRRRILHVATHVSAIGGHTRILQHWIKNDRSSWHSLAVIDQQDHPVPRWLSQAVRDSGGGVVVFPEARLSQKAMWLREAARQGADLVVLHHDPFDVVPAAAFASPQGPPVALLNLTDHQFWLGGSIADVVINLRTAGAEHAATRRFAAANLVIPVPLEDAVENVSRGDARRALGIPDEHVVLISVARPEKFRPSGAYDFVLTAGKILNRQPQAHLYVIGESAAGIAPYLRSPAHPRIHFMGSIEDPSRYRAAADVYLESFPFGSQTSLLEAAMARLPVVPAYAPLFPLLVANDDALHDVIQNPRDEQDYIDRAERLIVQPQHRHALGETLRARLLVDHVGDGWVNRLLGVYRETDRLTHRPRTIPVSLCSTTDADIALSLWHVVADGQTHSAVVSTDAASAILCHSAYVAKDVGDYASARRLAWRAVRNDPARRATWRLFGLAVLGRAGRFARRIVSRLI